MIVRCWAETFWNLLTTGELISGHDYHCAGYRVAQGVEWQTLKCARCGHVSEAWLPWFGRP